MYTRILEKYLVKSLKNNKIIVLYGARQVGKTTLVKKIMDQYSGKKKYYLCDDSDVQRKFSKSSIESLQHLVSGYDLVVFDEAQNIKDIGIKLKILHDTFPNIKIITTGSSSFELANKINEPLTGRTDEYTLFPLSLEEIAQKHDHFDIEKKLEYILLYGLYPAVWDKPYHAAIRELKTIAKNYLYKDILHFEGIKKSDYIFDLLRLLAFQIGQEVSYNELAKSLGLNKITIQKYMTILEQAFIIFKLPSFSKNLRNEIGHSIKIYFWDIGIRNSLINNFNDISVRNDVGGLRENFCIIERMKFTSYHQYYLNPYFWRTYQQQEIDFIEEQNGNLRVFEFKRNPKKKAHIPKAFLDAYKNDKNYQKIQFHCINQENFEHLTQ